MEKIADIKEKLKRVSEEELPALIKDYEKDARAGVRQAAASAARRLAAWEKEKARIHEMLAFEREYADAGMICGIDEAGRGPLAGPVVAAAVVLSPDDPIFYVNDSKKLSARKREELFDQIMERAVSVGVGMADPDVIDRINILQADYEAMRQAVSKLSAEPGLCLNDAVHIPDLPIRQVSIVHGDARSLSIAAASIIAKVTRDRIMERYDQLYPEYGFAKHKGYGTAGHIQAIRDYGPCPIHRMSFIHSFVGQSRQE